MIISFLTQLKNLDKNILNIIKYGIRFSIILSIISIFILINYKYNPISIDTYYIGIQLFKTSLSFVAEFIICGFAIDKINKEI